MRLLASAAPALLAAALPAGASNVFASEQLPQYFGTGRALIWGTVPAELHGEPPAGLDGPGFVALLRGPPAYAGLRFALSPEARDRPRLVVAFGTGANAGLCTDPRPGGDPRLVAIALCLGDTPASRVSLALPAGDRLETALAEAMVALLPAHRRGTNDSPR